jgi:PAS domain S-box-containing protein
MGNHIRLLKAAGIWLFILLTILPAQAESPPLGGSRILIINSYHSGLDWTDSIMNGIRDTFAKSGLDIEISAEYLDARRFPDPEHARRIRDFLMFKLQGTAPNLVMVSDNAALDFVLSQRDQLFAGIPIVFCGINDFNPSRISGYRGITGVAEDVSIVETVDLALRLHPETREIIVIGRASVAADKYNRDSVVASLPRLPHQLEVTFWDDLPVPQLRARLEKLKKSSLIFLNGLIRDQTGRELMYAETTKWICRYSTVPVYSFWDVLLGNGIVGGKLVSGYRQGQIAAELATEILHGESSDRLPVVSAADANRYMLDYRQLVRYGIPLSKLPGNSILINRPDTFYNKYKTYVWATATLVLVLSSLVIFLSFTMVYRRRATEALSKSEEALRQANLVVENSPVVLFRWRAAEGWPVEFVSRNVSQFGYTPEELLSGAVPFALIVHPRDLQRVAGEVEGYCAEGVDQFRQEYRIVTKEGEVRWVDDHTVVKRDVGGQVTEFHGIVIDISERKQAEEALRASEIFLETVIEHSPGPMWVSDRKGTLIRMNQACRDLFHVTDKDLVGKYNVFEDNIVEEQGVMPLVKRVFEHGEKVRFILNYDSSQLRSVRLGEMTQVVLEVTISAVMDARKRVSHAIIQHLDITERRRSEEETRRLRNYLSNIIDSMPSVMVGVDIKGCVTLWNAAAERTTGIRAEEARGKLLGRLLPVMSRQLDKVQHAMGALMVQTEAKMPRIVDGETRYEDVTVYPLVSNGVDGAVIRVDDVTERVRIEEMILQSEKMLSIGGLAAGMAHEINNPLGVILQASQNVLRRISPDLPANARVAGECGINLSSVGEYLKRREILTFLDDIRQSGERAAEIVSNMLSFSRKADKEGIRTDLAELLDRTVSLAASDYNLKKHYDFRQIAVEREYEPDTPLVLCNAVKIQQVFLNILRNGAEAMTAAGDSDLTPLFILRVSNEGSMVRVEIEDNGPGMDEAVRKRIFEPFFTTKPPGLGTGLGLSVSYFIVTEDHGGTISVESTPGMGASFVIRLPVEGRRP